MVGDDWMVDIVGANQFGICSVFISLKKEIESETIRVGINNKSNVYIIDNITELMVLL